MLKFIYVILMNLFRAPYMIPKMHKEADHPEKYSEEERYELARHVIRLMKTTGGIKTKAYGLENLPSEGGYMMYPNHQESMTHLVLFIPIKNRALSSWIVQNPIRSSFGNLSICCGGKRLDKKDVRCAYNH